MVDTRSFRTSRRGYDRDDVLSAIADATAKVEQLEGDRATAEKSVERLSRELADLRGVLKRANSKPTFADLGSAFEHTLRVAEEQADKMIKDATAEARILRESARAEAEQVTRSARLKAEKGVAEAEGRSEELRVDAERRVTELTIQADARNAEARTSIEISQRKAGAIIAEAEREASDIRARVHQETEDVKTELSTLRQMAEREQLRIEREI